MKIQFKAIRFASKLLAPASLVWTLALFLGAPLAGSIVPGVAFGVANAQQCPVMNPGRVVSIRQKNIKKYEKVAELFDEEKLATAKSELAKIAALPDLNQIEKAYLYNYLGNIAFSQDRNNEALSNFKKILAIKEGISPQFYNQIIYVVAQVYFSQENYQQALFYSQCWLRTTEDPPADAYILVGQAQYMLKRYDDALGNVQKGISLYKQQGSQPKEGWLNILVGIYREKNQYSKMVSPLKQLLTYYPRRSYFVTLGGVYNELGDQAKMTAVYQALYDKGLLNGESEFVTLASLNMSQDNPYKATKILEEGKSKGIIKNNQKNNRLLAQAYMMSAEYEKALPPLRAAANASKDGKLSEQLGSSLVALNRWKEAEAAYKQALNKGKLSNTGQTLINLGLTQFEQKKFESARATFVRAAKIESTIKTANQWIRYVDSEVARIKELEKPIVIGTNVQPLES